MGPVNFSLPRFNMKKENRKLWQQLKTSRRLTYPDDEAKHPWLAIILTAHHIVDTGITIELGEEEAKRQAKTACQRGCSNCCALFPDIPVSPLEILGISWFVMEQLAGDVRKEVSERITRLWQIGECPFLISSVCSVYPMRPLACRMFFVFGSPCRPGENVARTRPDDAWWHSKAVTRPAAMAMLPYYGITGKDEKARALSEGYIYSISDAIYELSWSQLENYDQNT